MQKGTIFGIIAIIVSVGYVAYSEFPQQIATAQTGQRSFLHAGDFLDALDGAEYMDGTPVGFSPYVSTVTVENWDNVKALDKTAIRTQANLYGYEEIVPP